MPGTKSAFHKCCLSAFLSYLILSFGSVLLISLLLKIVIWFFSVPPELVLLSGNYHASFLLTTTVLLSGLVPIWPTSSHCLQYTVMEEGSPVLGAVDHWTYSSTHVGVCYDWWNKVHLHGMEFLNIHNSFKFISHLGKLSIF